MARRLRSGTWGPGVGAGRAPGSVENGQAIAEWLAAYGPVLASAFAEQEWPETVVCDSTRFMYTNRRTGTTRQLFCVLGVWGYPAGEKEGRLWRLAASPDQDSRAWQHVLASLPGRPSSVVCDRDYAIIDAVRATWGKGRNAVPVHLCEHHLYERAKKALAEDGITEFGHRLHELLNEAFTTPAGWEAFYSAATAAGGRARSWARHWNERMRTQTARRASLPAHYGNGAIEPHMVEIHEMLDRRSWTFRNLERMNLRLELARLARNHLDDERAYTALIRQHLLANGGRPEANWRSVRDPRRTDKRVSMSSLRAWVA